MLVQWRPQVCAQGPAHLPAQVQVSQAAVELQAVTQTLHPSVAEPHGAQVELQQAAVDHQHLRKVHCPALLQGAADILIYFLFPACSHFLLPAVPWSVPGGQR